MNEKAPATLRLPCDTPQPNATRLAEWLDANRDFANISVDEVAAELRRLHARVQELERAAPQWVPMAERLPEFMQPCDWLHHDEIKQECWVLCGESMATASVPGSATHWRPAQPLPPRARGAQGDEHE